MRAGGLIAVILLAISCSAGPGQAVANSPGQAVENSPGPSSLRSPSPTASPTGASYGLLLSGGYLQMITPSGTVAASARVAAASAHTCGHGVSALLQPPVSATKNAVFYRSGNTTIRYMKPDGENLPLTTVPGGGSKISFFSVSPNGDRIAVLVEDFSPSATINLALYVEDIGHANHKVIYTNSTPKSKSGTTLWPMGWHGGSLVLAVFPVCKFGSAGSAPIEWHVANTSTANRLAKIGNPCVPSYWPSPAGVVCLTPGTARAVLYDWAGMIISGGAPAGADHLQSGLSPSGVNYFTGTGAPAPATHIQSRGPGSPSRSVAGHSACVWIDDEHLMAPDAMIAFQPFVHSTPSPIQTATPLPTGTPFPTSTPVPTPSPGSGALLTVTALPAAGQCAGRFPGGL